MIPRIQVSCQSVDTRGCFLAPIPALKKCITNEDNIIQLHSISIILLCSILTGRKHELTACKFVKNGLTGRIYCETFQTLTVTSNDNKDAEYTCFKVFRYSGF